MTELYAKLNQLIAWCRQDDDTIASLGKATLISMAAELVELAEKAEKAETTE